jgi:hypothetical protein
VRPAVLASLVALSTCAGCSTFRLTAGYGLGLGASVHASVVDVGLVFGFSQETGNCYGLTGKQDVAEYGLPLFGRTESICRDDPRVYWQRYEGPLGVYMKFRDTQHEFCLTRPAELAFGLYLGIASVHAGFDFEELVRLVFGLEKEPTRMEEKRAPPAEGADPTDYLFPGWAALDPHTSPLELDARIEEPLSLVAEVAPGDARTYISPARALVERYDPNDPAFAAVAAREEERSAKKIERALAARDPDFLAEAIRGAPLAPSSRAALDVLASLRLERGDLEEAIEAFDLEAKLAADETTRDEAAERARLARSARTPGSPEKAENNTFLGPVVLGADAFSCHGLTATGEVAWIRSDLLLKREVFLRPVPIMKTQDLALLETGDPESRVPYRIVALDASGNERWEARLRGGDYPTLYAVGSGRLYGVSRYDAFALDPETGRYEWLYLGTRKLKRIVVPFGEALPGPEPDLLPSVDLVGGVLEWFPCRAEHGLATDESRVIERVDAATGRPVRGRAP